MTKFPLCEELGLTPSIHEGHDFEWVVSADKLERLLSQAPVVDMVEACQMGGKSFYRTITMADKDDAATHTARLIGIKLIEKDTAESLLRDYLVEYEKFMRGEGDSISVKPWVKRVRKLLEGK